MICRPSDHTVGRPLAEIRNQAGRSRGRDSTPTPPHLLNYTSLKTTTPHQTTIILTTVYSILELAVKLLPFNFFYFFLFDRNSALLKNMPLFLIAVWKISPLLKVTEIREKIRKFLFMEVIWNVFTVDRSPHFNFFTKGLNFVFCCFPWRTHFHIFKNF